MNDSSILGSVTSGSLLVAVPLAIIAGTISFLSPCTLPLLPSYLSYVSGLSGAQVIEGGANHRRRLVLGACLFVLGFSSVFVLLGVTAGGLYELIPPKNSALVQVPLGVLTVLMGAVFFGLPFLQREIRLVGRFQTVGLAGAPLLGILFGIGWTPCIGPTLSGIMSLAYVHGNATRGGLLLLAYAGGLGFPFVLSAVAINRVMSWSRSLRKHQRTFGAVGGGLLMTIGILVLVGSWDPFVAAVQAHLSGLLFWDSPL